MRALLLAVLLGLCGCASAQRTLSYPGGWPDADVYVGGARYQVWFHERDPTVLVLRGDPRPLGQLMAENLTVYANDRSPAGVQFGAAADAVLRQIGCGAADIKGANLMREVSYWCQSGVDVDAQLAAHREAWRRGVRTDAPAG